MVADNSFRNLKITDTREIERQLFGWEMATFGDKENFGVSMGLVKHKDLWKCRADGLKQGPTQKYTF